jgi:alkanesulfonate monooxygenase SsuD/methylene tetrahydromethanopterin reductase-like flavin-dependent oxidoreductase (luciferase family)
MARATLTDATIIDTAQRDWPVILGIRGDDDDNRRQAALYRDTLERCGHATEVVDECVPWLGFISMVCIAETERDAKRRITEFTDAGGLAPIVAAVSQGLMKETDQAGRRADEFKNRQLSRAQKAVVGTPEMIAEHVLAYRDVGVDHARVSLMVTPGRHEENMDCFRLFLAEVLPHLEPQSLPGPTRSVRSTPVAGRETCPAATRAPIRIGRARTVTAPSP